ncbi:MAG: GldG family protein [Myxococcota bacterium]
MRIRMHASHLLATLFMVGTIVFINLLSLQYFVRLDLTQDSKYTLADASRKTVQSLPDVVVVQAYFSRDLPSPYASYARYTKDLLEEYRIAADGNFAFSFTNPAAQQAHEQAAQVQQLQRDIFGQTVHPPTQTELDLAHIGVEPVQVKVIEDDAEKMRQIYMGLVIHYQDRYETIPFVHDMGNLEKNLTVLMRKLVDSSQPVLGFVDTYDGMRTNKLRQLLAASVQIKPLNPDHVGSLDDVDALLFVGKPQEASLTTIQAIENFLVSGRNALFLLDAFDIHPSSFAVAAALPQQLEQQGIYTLLQRYGVRLGRQLVGDVQCAKVPIQQQIGDQLLTRCVPYPFTPTVVDFDADNPITHKLRGVVWPFAAALTAADVPTSLSATVLARSSDKSWLESPPCNTNPQRNWNATQTAPSGAQALLLEIKGKFLPEEIAPQQQSIDDNLAKIVVAGSSALVWDSSLQTKANVDLALNLIDSMVADNDLLHMRTREFIDVPLRQDISPIDRRLLKYGNIIGAPLFLVLIGLFRWSLRELYRKTIRAKLLDPGKRNKRDPSILL